MYLHVRVKANGPYPWNTSCTPCLVLKFMKSNCCCLELEGQFLVLLETVTVCPEGREEEKV